MDLTWQGQIRESRHPEYRAQPLAPKRWAAPPLTLLLGGLGFDFFDDDGFGAASLVDLAAGGDFISGEREKLGILAGGWSGVRDGPIDGAIVGENDERRTGVRARSSARFTDGFFETFCEGTGGVKNVAFYDDCGIVRGAEANRSGEKDKES